MYETGQVRTLLLCERPKATQRYPRTWLICVLSATLAVLVIIHTCQTSHAGFYNVLPDMAIESTNQNQMESTNQMAHPIQKSKGLCFAARDERFGVGV